LILRVSKSSLGGLFGSSTTQIQLIPRGLNQADLETMFAFFDIVTFERFGEVLAILSPTKRALLQDKPDGFAAAISSVTGSFGSIVTALQSLKSSASSEVTQQFMGAGNGFAHLKQYCQIQRLVGMTPSKLDDFSRKLIARIKFPAARTNDFLNTLEDIPFFESQQIMSYDFLFDMNNGGDCKYVSILIERRADDKINWLIADYQANFKLAPNVFVIRKQKSILGMWSSSKDTFKEVPRGVTNDDVEFIFKWMQLTSFKRFADLLGIPAPDPQGI